MLSVNWLAVIPEGSCSSCFSITITDFKFLTWQLLFRHYRSALKVTYGSGSLVKVCRKCLHVEHTYFLYCIGWKPLSPYDGPAVVHIRWYTGSVEAIKISLLSLEVQVCLTHYGVSSKTSYSTNVVLLCFATFNQERVIYIRNDKRTKDTQGIKYLIAERKYTCCGLVI
jgi:hypothetical protein